MSVEGVEFVTVQSDYITVDVVIWRRYRTQAPGILEMTLDINPHLAKLHRTSPFLPVGTQLRIPIDPDILENRPTAKETTQLWGTADKPGTLD